MNVFQHTVKPNAFPAWPLFNGICVLYDLCGWGLGPFLRWWPLSAMWAGSLIYYGRNWGCLNDHIFFNLGLCAACWTYFMCHHEMWPKSVSHPFSFLNSSLGLVGRKHYQKITIPVFRIVLQNFCYSRVLSLYSFPSLSFSLLSSGWFVIEVCGFISVRELVRSESYCKLM